MTSAPELWGGHECTVNRIGYRFQDQTRLSGHQDRIEDLARFADLGVKALRYPVLWERTAPDRPDDLDFSWSDARLGEMAGLALRPIVGLLHHGSGPIYTHLLDPDFAPGLATFAAAVARRYPHVVDWTPVNEPLTTARFSCLYGLWWPHQRDERALWLALLNQIDGVRLAMREIRKVQPQARLIQTEDLGRTYATAPLESQARFENHRRWLTWDLLCGRVTPDHPMHRRLADCGLGDRLMAIADDPCPPEVLGVNHYVTSERFLDHRTAAYPADRIGGNGQVAYADVEAVRVGAPAGLEGVLREVWDRYGRTLAVTESHLGCTREEQVRWLRDAWRTAGDLSAGGIDIEAVTAWSLLGAYDWNSLLTRPAGHYESGAFDLRGGAPRPTAVAHALRALAEGRDQLAPPVDGPGWWSTPARLILGRPSPAPPATTPKARQVRALRRPLLITGATGTLGRAFAAACEVRGLAHVVTERRRLDLTNTAAIEKVLDELRPWGVINTAGWVRVDDAEEAEAECHAVNAAGAARLARACAERDLAFVGFSSDLVFDGAAGRPYAEDDDCAPLNAYGRSKAEAEAAILALGGRALVVRTAAFFSANDPYNFAADVRRRLTAGETAPAAHDQVVSPTYVPDLVTATLDLAIDGEVGLWHLANQGAVSWADFAGLVATASGLPGGLVRPVSSAELRLPAKRPAYSALTSRRGLLLPTIDDAIARYAAAAA